jgi:hypothetical protein
MEKILKIQSEIGVLVKTETNPFFKSKYMDINGLLEQLLPLLEKHGLTVVQPLSHIDGKPALRTIIYDKTILKVNGKETNYGDINTIMNEVIPLPDLQDPQKMGSAITYYRRYALQSLFLLRAQDDDGNHASQSYGVASALPKPVSKAIRNKSQEDYKLGNDPF